MSFMSAEMNKISSLRGVATVVGSFFVIFEQSRIFVVTVILTETTSEKDLHQGFVVETIMKA
jgi:hypothetical protein